MSAPAKYVPPWKRNQQANASTDQASPMPSANTSSLTPSTSLGRAPYISSFRRPTYPHLAGWSFNQIADKIGPEGHTWTPFSWAFVLNAPERSSTSVGPVTEQLKSLRLPTSEERFAASSPSASRRQILINSLAARDEPVHPLHSMVSWLKIMKNAHPNFNLRSQNPAAVQELWLHTGSEMLEIEPRNLGRPIPAFWWYDREGRLGQELSGVLVEPGSQELISMLETKDKMNAYQGGRTSERWIQALKDSWVKVQITRYVPKPGEPSLVNPMEHEDFEVQEIEYDVKVYEKEIASRIARMEERERRIAEREAYFEATGEWPPLDDKVQDDWEVSQSKAADGDDKCLNLDNVRSGDFIVVKRKYKRFVGWESYILGHIEGLDLAQ